MKKNLGVIQAVFPMPVLIVAVKKISAWEHGKAVLDEAEIEKIKGMK